VTAFCLYFRIRVLWRLLYNVYRLLTFPTVLQRMFTKLSSLKNKFSGMFAQVAGMLAQSGSGASQEAIFDKLEKTRENIDEVKKLFEDPESTTFVCVAIPEFLSLFETERLVQALTKYEIDTHNIVVNQVHTLCEENKNCGKCKSRWGMQKKYLDQIKDLYEDFHVTVCPLLDSEVRGKEGIEKFAKLLSTERKI
jgi:arsenite-transporting ATPase